MKLLWLDINSSYSHSSLALPLLEQACASQGLDLQWDILRGTAKDDPVALTLDGLKSAPDILLATVYLFNRTPVMRLAKRIKALYPKCLVVFGGPEFLGDNEPFLRHEDFVWGLVRGEGETALPLLLKKMFAAGFPETPDALDNIGAEINCITGLCRIDSRTNGYIDNGVAISSAAEFEAISLPISSPFFDWGKPFVQLETSRGCPKACTFCTSSRTGPPRYLPLETVKAALSEIQKKGVSEIRVLDRTFNFPLPRTANLLRLFRDEFPVMNFHLEWHPDFLDDTVFDILKTFPDRRLKLEVGFQTGNEDALAACRRRGAGTDTESFENLRKLCELRNLEIHVDMIAGLPGQPFGSVLGDLHEITLLSPAEIQLELLKILPGTPVRASASELRITYSPDEPYEVLRTSQMSESELGRTRKISVMVDLFYNQRATQGIVVSANRRAPDFYSSFLSVLDHGGFFERRAYSIENRMSELHKKLSADRDVESLELLEFNWFRHGLSISGYPWDNARKVKDGIPGDAKLAEGTAIAGPDGHSIWKLMQSNVEFFFVFSREIHRSRPCAIYRRPA